MEASRGFSFFPFWSVDLALCPSAVGGQSAVLGFKQQRTVAVVAGVVVGVVAAVAVVVVVVGW